MSSSMENESNMNQKKIYKENPLKPFHFWYIICMGINIPFYTIQYFSTLFLLSQTSAGCDYKHYISILSIIKISSDAVIIPTCGWITDHFSKSNHFILGLCIMIRIILSITNFIIIAIYSDTTSATIWWIVVSNLLFNACGVQLNYSMVKVVKIQIELNNKTNKEIQIAFLTRIGIYAKFIGNISVFIVALILYLLIKYGVIAIIIYILIIILVILFGVIMFISSVAVYKMQSKLLHDFPIKSVTLQPLLINEEFEDNIDNEIDATTQRRCCCYCTVCDICKNKIIRYGIIHLIIVYILTDLLISYEPLHIAGVHASEHKTFDNFCGSILENLMYQNVFSALLYAIFALLYIVILIPFVTNWRFYRYIYPLIAIISTISVFLISGIINFNETVLALSLSALFAVFDYAHYYDDFLVLAYIPSSAVGFYQFIYLITKNGWQICGYLFLYLGISNYIVIAMITILLIASMIISFVFSKIFHPSTKTPPLSID